MVVEVLSDQIKKANLEAKQFLFERLGYQPTPEQALIHGDQHRFKFVAGGEGGGKSVCAAKEVVGDLGNGKLYWLVGKDYAQTRKEFEYIVEDYKQLGILLFASSNVNPGEITAEGGIHIETKSAVDPRKLGAESPDGILACEGQQLDLDTILRLRGRVARSRGWFHIIGTFEYPSLGWAQEYWVRWQGENTDGGKSFSLPSWSNTFMYPGGRNDSEILSLEAGCTKDYFNERYAGIPCQPAGRVFPEFSALTHVRTLDNSPYVESSMGTVEKAFCDDIHRTVLYDPVREVHLFVDPGYGGAYAILACYIVGNTVFVFDELYFTGVITESMIEMCRKRPWWKNVKDLSIDVAAEQHHAMPGVAETWLKLTKMLPRMKKVGINEGNERFRSFLMPHPISLKPNTYIAPECKGLISELGGCANPITNQIAIYQWKMQNGVIIGKTPEDANNHACRAMVYGLVDHFGYATAAFTAARKSKVYQGRT